MCSNRRQIDGPLPWRKQTFQCVLYAASQILGLEIDLSRAAVSAGTVGAGVVIRPDSAPIAYPRPNTEYTLNRPGTTGRVGAQVVHPMSDAIQKSPRPLVGTDGLLERSQDRLAALPSSRGIVMPNTARMSYEIRSPGKMISGVL